MVNRLKKVKKRRSPISLLIFLIYSIHQLNGKWRKLNFLSSICLTLTQALIATPPIIGNWIRKLNLLSLGDILTICSHENLHLCLIHFFLSSLPNNSYLMILEKRPHLPRTPQYDFFTGKFMTCIWWSNMRRGHAGKEGMRKKYCMWFWIPNQR